MAKLHKPLTINSMEIKNRIGLAPLLNMPDLMTRLEITERTLKWFEARALGGAGLIMTGGIAPDMILKPGFKDGLMRLAEMVNSHGARLGVQLVMGGPMGGQGPSAPPYPDNRHNKMSVNESFGEDLVTVKVLEVPDLKGYQMRFREAAVLLKNARVDCLELHCGHGGATLLGSFISPFYNHREDEYGGSWENRLRFPLETIEQMRKGVGRDYPILVRISADELLGPRGITLKDTVSKIAPAFEAAQVDALDISMGSIPHSPEGSLIPMYYPRGCYIDNAAKVKQAVKIPVIGLGRIVEMEMAEKFLADDMVDMIFMGRQLTADPDTPKKYFTGKADEIRKCLACLEGCGTPCPVNYEIDPDALPLEITSSPKKVVIVGGGVAGMEAARVASLMGHRVTLLEKSLGLGGNVAKLSKNNLNHEFQNLVDYLSLQMKKQGVDVRVAREVDADEVVKHSPDAVILATGSKMVMPKIIEGVPGVMSHIEAVDNMAALGKKVIIWGLVYGAELACSLAEDGKEVTLIGEAGEKALAGLAAKQRQYYIIRKLTDMNVVRNSPSSALLTNPTVYCRIKVVEVSTGRMTIRDNEDNETELTFDSLIISRRRKPVNSLFNELKGKVPQIYKIGDAWHVGKIKDAVWAANETVRKI